jgi:ubiquinone/menaquinone biosynthesis C-methylase UbiE
MKTKYVHGYSERESVRLTDQANCLSELLHYDTIFNPGDEILEVGCGTGSQTAIIAKKNPHAHFLSIDHSAESLEQAKKVIEQNKIQNVTFKQTDIFNLPFKNACFDAIFICFVLEHLSAPLKALKKLKRVLKRGGRIIAIEGDHGSAYYHPASPKAQQTIQCQVTLQAKAGGNALIGRQLYPLLKKAIFRDCRVSPRMVYVDASRPQLVKGFTRNTFIAMIEGVKQNALAKGLITASQWKAGIKDLYKTARKHGVFCYTFFKATGKK